MRRAPIVITGTAIGTAAVLSFHARTPDSIATVVSTPVPTTTGPSSSSATKTVTGDAVATRYGNAQVKVTLAGGKITGITALQLQGNDPKSVQISSAAEPTLRQEALQEQKAAVDAVSGATITSASYEASLQSALDKAGFKASDGTRASSTIPQVQEHDGGPGGGGPDDGGFLGPGG